MKIISIQLVNIRGFRQTGQIPLSGKINLFIGPNNSGKSTILKSIFIIQQPSVLTSEDRTIGEIQCEIVLRFIGYHPQSPDTIEPKEIIIRQNQKRTLIQENGQSVPHIDSPQYEPSNLIYPYLSKRKTVGFDETINKQNTNNVTGDVQFLYSKIDRLITPHFQPGNEQYKKACKNILGFEVSTLATSGGKRAVYFIRNSEHIPLTAMGEGVTSILGLVTDLCVAEDRIFIIEEPENDIHPKALKALLNLIIEKSKTNQFFISTHSNIVMRYLGGVESTKIFKVVNDLRDEKRPNLFLSQIFEVSPDPEERRIVLEELGYDFCDFGLWDGWLFLEESSAEGLIRDWFFKWYAKSLKNKIRTFSAASLNQVEPKFEDFNRLFVYFHLEPAYKNKVWVIIDGGLEESGIIEKLKQTYTPRGWLEDHFSQFSEHDFEKYYPPIFQTRVDEVLALTDKKQKKEEKKALLEKVKAWIASDEELAKNEFKISAAPVIEKLKEIAKALK